MTEEEIIEAMARAMCLNDPKFACDGCPDDGCEAPPDFLIEEGYRDKARAAYAIARQEIERRTLAWVVGRLDLDIPEPPERAFDAKPPAWAQDSFNNNAAASCGYCGAWMEVVRPGKTQCGYCFDGKELGARLFGWACPSYARVHGSEKGEG